MLPSPTPLIATKLHRPFQRTKWVPRSELLIRLNAGLERKLSLLSAPAGFGKTTLAIQWATGCVQPVAWLSLDQHDNQPTLFLRYIIAAVRTCVPDACPMTHSLLTAAYSPTVEYLTDSLVGEFSALTLKMILILDDYHHVQSPEVHRIMRRLLRYLPPTLHLVILTHSDPPLHLGRLRIAQQVTELRARDLRFGLEETRQFLEYRLAQSLDEEMTEEIVREIADALHTRTDGWIAGLELASISLQHQEGSNLLLHFHGNDRLLVGYFIEEVMENLPETLQRFLLQIALVDRFCAPLADALLGDNTPWISSQALIAQMEEMNLFVVALDEERYWYRFHDLFREFLLFGLRRQWSPSEVACLHRRASDWLAQAGFIEDALRHALATGDDEYAARLFEAQFHTLVNRQVPIYTLQQWLTLFTEQAINAHPGLILAKAGLTAFGLGSAFSPHQFPHIEALIENDRTLSDSRRQSLQADLDLFRGIFAYAHDDPHSAVVYLEDALITLPIECELFRAQATIHLAVAYASTGEQEAGDELLDTALTEAMAQKSPIAVILVGARAINQLYAAQLPEVLRTAEKILMLANAPTARVLWQDVAYVDVWRGRAHYLRGVIYYEHNELDAAAHEWRQVEALRYRTHPAPYHDSLIGLALVARKKNAPEEMQAYVRAARQFAAESHNVSLLAKSDALDVRLALLDGKTAEAVVLAQDFTISANQGTAVGLTLPPLMRAAALLRDASPVSLETVLQITQTCLDRAGRMHNMYLTIQVSVYQALAYRALGRREEALDALALALSLSKPGRFIRTFLDLGTPLAELMSEFAAHRDSTEYLRILQASFEQEYGSAQSDNPPVDYVKRYGISPLTPRELEVLTLISQRLTQAEIADALVISVRTVKNHTHRIYRKLDVRGRQQAVVKARELGLLPPHSDHRNVVFRS